MSRLRTTLVATASLAAVLGGCITPYRVDIAQGNIIAPEMVDQLRPGMTHSQVRFILGTPLVADPFHANRWDYYYSLKKGTDDVAQMHHLTVIFKDDALESFEGDVTPAKPAAPATSANTPPRADTASH